MDNFLPPLKKSSNIDFYDMLLNDLQEAVIIFDPSLRVIFWNTSSEQITGYNRDEVLGKPCLKNVLLDQKASGIFPCKTDCPALQTLQDGQIRSLEAFLQHKQGYRFPVHIRIIPIKNQDGKIIAALETFRELSPKVSVPQKKSELQRMGLLDPLTELGNRRYLEMHLNSRLEEMKRYGLPFGILILDVDDMENINEAYGTVTGNKVLKMISQTLASNIRFFEVTGRWNGEQFLVVLLNLDEKKLDLVANKLRLLVEQSYLKEIEASIKTTVSIGATLAQFNDSAAGLIARAEKLVEHSKWQGKNKVSLKIEKK
jgi:diguanylate cyclase (GGDEF)-like protein/PAS domain S-box-containing protein